MSDELVALTTAASEAEAAMICGFLASNGIEASYDTGGVTQPALGGGSGLGGAFIGRQQILVREQDLDEAARLLEDLPG